MQRVGAVERLAHDRRPSGPAASAGIEQPWPLHRVDSLLLAQTLVGRPMTTHHTLELDRPVTLDGWARALIELVRDYPELGARVEQGVMARRSASIPPTTGLHERLIAAHDGSRPAIERWLATPIDPTEELPIRVRVGPGQVAAQAVTLSLHHSLCDSVAALRLFDRLLAFAACEPIELRRSRPFAGYAEPRSPGLRALLSKLCQLRRPAAQIVDRSPSWALGQRLVVRRVGARAWASFGRRCRAAGVSRSTGLWHAAARAAARQRLDDRSRPLRLLAGVDLRRALGVPHDALGNWLGTLELEHPVDALPGLAELHAALATARRVDAAWLTPALLSSLVRWLPRAYAQALLGQIDFSLAIAPLRVPPRCCWPLRLQPRRLWSSSTLPRRIGVGVTVTRVGDRAWIAATCQAAALRRATLERFVDDLLGELA